MGNRGPWHSANPNIRAEHPRLECLATNQIDRSSNLSLVQGVVRTGNPRKLATREAACLITDSEASGAESSVLELVRCLLVRNLRSEAVLFGHRGRSITQMTDSEDAAKFRTKFFLPNRFWAARMGCMKRARFASPFIREVRGGDEGGGLPPFKAWCGRSLDWRIVLEAWSGKGTSETGAPHLAQQTLLLLACGVLRLAPGIHARRLPCAEKRANANSRNRI